MNQHLQPSSDPRDLLDRVQFDMAHHHMYISGDRVVVAVSGGPDSVALLDLLFRLKSMLGINLHVAHLNHRLRGAQSDSDADFVGTLASNLNLPYHTQAVDLCPKGQSLEEAARNARHAFLNETRSRTGATRIALGHTRSDQAETLLLRLLRGAGTRGLAAIRPVRDGIWIRPLLAISRPEIEAYIAWRGLPVRHDASNTDTRFLRNRIRHDLLPRLAADYTPAIETLLARSAEILRQDDELLEEQAEAALQKALRHRGKQKIILDENVVFRYHISLRRRLLRKALFGLQVPPEKLGFQTLHRLHDLFSQPFVKQAEILPGLTAQRTASWLILSHPTPAFQIEVRVPGCTEIPCIGGTLEARVRPVHEVRNDLAHLGPCRACFDLDALPEPLTIRNRKSGDRIHPFGLSGTPHLHA